MRRVEYLSQSAGKVGHLDYTVSDAHAVVAVVMGVFPAIALFAVGLDDVKEGDPIASAARFAVYNYVLAAVFVTFCVWLGYLCRFTPARLRPLVFGVAVVWLSLNALIVYAIVEDTWLSPVGFGVSELWPW